MERFYEGPESLFVRAYDAFYHDAPPPTVGDVAFYQQLAQQTGGTVLELACGSGRIALPLAESGLDVTGVDVSAGMLAILQRKAAAAQHLTTVLQDMSSLELNKRFGCVIVAFRSFQHLLTVELQRQTLAAIGRHLLPGGRVALHLFDPRLDLLTDEAPSLILRGTDPATGHAFTGELLGARFDYVTQIRRDFWRYREFAPHGALLAEDAREMALRWTYRWELHHLLELCGFSVEAEYSDFHRSPPAYGKELIVVARKSNG